MRKTLIVLVPILGLSLVLAGYSFAHTPLCSCSDQGDGTVLCEGGFSDGSSAAGVKMKVLDGDGNVIVEGKVDDYGEFIFKKPEGNYTVIFDAGPGHEVKVPSKDIAAW